MKNQLIFKSAVLTIIFCSISLFVACKQQPKEEDTKDVAEEKNEAKFQSKEEEDAEFLVGAAEFNLQQAQLGKLVTIKSNNADVKAFGSMMQDMHNESLKDLNVLAASKQISIPTALTEENKEDYNALNKKDIEDFDKQYIEDVVKEHTKTIEDYNDQVEKITDPDIKNWLRTQLDTLREHLDKAMTLQSKLEK